MDFDYYTEKGARWIGDGYNPQHELFSKAQNAYVEEHSRQAKAAGEGLYKKGYNYKKVIDEYAESVRV